MKKTFDDIIRKRWDDRHFDVDDAHRQEMIALLDGKKRRKAFPVWWWGAGVVVLAAVGYLWLRPANETIVEFTEKSLKQATVEEISADPLSTSSSNDTSSSDESSLENIVSKEISHTRDNRISKKITNAAQGRNVKESTTASPLSGDDVRVRENISNENVKLDSRTSKSSTKTTEVKTDFTSHTNQSQNTDDSIGQADRPADIVPSGYSIPVQNSNEEVIPVLVNKENPNTESNSEGAPIPVQNHNLPIQTRNLIRVTFLDALPIQNLDHSRHTGMQSIAARTRSPHPVYSFAETGFGIVLASKTEYDAGIKFNVGAGLGYQMKPRLHMLWSAGYLMQDGGFDFDRTSTVQQSGFGVRSQFNSLTPDRLHFVYTKLGMQYRSGKHVLYGGIGLQYLYGAQGNIQVLTEDKLTGDRVSTSQYAWLKTDGLRKWQWNTGLSYGYRITSRLQASIGGQFYFTRIDEENAPLQSGGYYWNGATAKVQPFITFNYLLYDLF